MEEKRIWGIHTMDDHLFLNNNVIAIGWKAIGDLSLIEADREAFKENISRRFLIVNLKQFPHLQVCCSDLLMKCKLEITLFFHQNLTGKLI